MARPPDTLIDHPRRAVLSAVLVVLVVAATVLWAARRDGAPPVADDPAAPATAGPPTAAETTESPPPGVDTTTAVFPFAEDGQRFADPLEAAQVYAERILGFVDPVYSEFRQGDARSGEVGVRPAADGPETTILVRQLDDSWWILGAGTEAIVVTEPAAGEVLMSPVVLRGEAAASGAAIDVNLWTDRADEPLAATTVARGGDQLRSFEATLRFDRRPATRSGALILREYRDGGVWAATVVRVHF